MMHPVFNEYQKFDFLNKLDNYSTLFNAVYKLGDAVYSDEINTAAVVEKDNQVYFLLNYNFFWSLTENERLFVICHEALHILFRHLDKIKEYNLNPRLANYAMDIVINESLVHHFHFKRHELPIANPKSKTPICFIDTIFTEEQIKKYKITLSCGFLYLYDCLLKEHDAMTDVLQSVLSIDEHHPILSQQNEKSDYSQSANSNSSNEDDKNNNEDDNKSNLPDNFQNESFKELSDELKEQIRESVFSNSNFDNSKFDEFCKDIFEGNELPKDYEMQTLDDYIKSDFRLFKVEKDNRWRKLIKMANPSIFSEKDIEEPSFGRENYSIGLILKDKNILLPGYKNDVELNKEKINLYFFFDVSGSCLSYGNLFLDLISKIPTRYFKLHIFAFSTSVQKLEIDYKNKKFKQKIVSGYGTSFDILQKQIDEDLANNHIRKYPDMVCVLTDGYGTKVKNIPLNYQKRWLWLLVGNNKELENFMRNMVREFNIIPFCDHNFNIHKPLINHNIKEGCKIYPLSSLI